VLGDVPGVGVDFFEGSEYNPVVHMYKSRSASWKLLSTHPY
jgi:hypothetical protein